jgi:hypothetical protein
MGMGRKRSIRDDADPDAKLCWGTIGFCRNLAKFRDAPDCSF